VGTSEVECRLDRAVCVGLQGDRWARPERPAAEDGITARSGHRSPGSREHQAKCALGSEGPSVNTVSLDWLRAETFEVVAHLHGGVRHLRQLGLLELRLPDRVLEL
jgi:hypothetical protein